MKNYIGIVADILLQELTVTLINRIDGKRGSYRLRDWISSITSLLIIVQSQGRPYLSRVRGKTKIRGPPKEITTIKLKKLKLKHSMFLKINFIPIKLYIQLYIPIDIIFGMCLMRNNMAEIEEIFSFRYSESDS